ncbi:gamma-glutamyltranspeptidase/glutathione hydrolase [Methylomarinovum tepidoasis]|uniref:Gamma-glutamyltranspeptidase/glutathione hydrolase n=1 Tax=Methylomarinovum tepidoasis TaxID=2840183 RepID=A0AAU9C3N1_9GAMM|nr:gamma-glutamyltransferase [Methylomarinovum sp. IN45]BCX88032.1 gamma-glutamyltranspeptidase/glutathione hydrolase [Methylomarinovum sp. IN45]
MSTLPKGIVAAGHPDTAAAATEILATGGNAFDAVVAAHLAACVVEPVLASLGGGGYLLSHDGHQTRLFDFFVQTPGRKRPPEEVEFFPIHADFGTTRQEFHIGRGAIATPGVVRGLWQIQRRLGRLPMTEVARPAIDLARHGVVVNDFQAYIFDIVSPIYRAQSETFATYRSPKHPDRLVQAGERLRQPRLADTIEALAREGEVLFYEGEIAAAVAALCAEGGLLTRADLETYPVIERRPLWLRYRDAEILTNPPPSSGGILIAFSLELLSHFDLHALRFGGPEHAGLLTAVQDLTRQVRRDLDLDDTRPGRRPALLAPTVLTRYLDQLAHHPLCRRGTTHISVMDAEGNCASLTTSNGEGCGWLIPGTGIMLNNMLGEADLNPHGFFQWPCDTRMTSMMAPSLARLPGCTVALGSGGSNRLRTAILQVLVNLIDFRMPLAEAVAAPRLHLEEGVVNLEPGFEETAVARLASNYAVKAWPAPNLFFGGVHAVARGPEEFEGTGDPRRGGVCRRV